MLDYGVARVVEFWLIRMKIVYLCRRIGSRHCRQSAVARAPAEEFPPPTEADFSDYNSPYCSMNVKNHQNQSKQAQLLSDIIELAITKLPVDSSAMAPYAKLDIKPMWSVLLSKTASMLLSSSVTLRIPMTVLKLLHRTLVKVSNTD